MPTPKHLKTYMFSMEWFNIIDVSIVTLPSSWPPSQNSFAK
jgi:hypothetical protein